MSYEKIVIVYKLNKRTDQTVIEFQGLRKSKVFEFSLHEVRSIKVRLLALGSVYGYPYARYQLYFLRASGKEFVLDEAVGAGDMRELEEIACHFREFLFNH